MTARQRFLRASKALGLFRLARRLQPGGLRILCYHSVALEDEHTFLPKMFVSPQTFERRLAFLAGHGFPVLPLDEAARRLREGTLPPGATVITFDDALYSTGRLAWPLLQRFAMPATVYVTTYHVVKRTPVFDLIIQYLFWRTTKPSLSLADLGLPTADVVVLSDPAVKAQLVEDLIVHGEIHCSEAQRGALIRTLAERLAVDAEPVFRHRLFNLMTLEEIHDLSAAGLDVQAHTHRHRFPENEGAVLTELAENRALLEPVTGRRLEHFCYPSGVWSARHWPWLLAAGFKTATTCEPGFNYPDTPALALRRFLDGEHIAEVEFEAELCGYAELLRRGRAGLRRAVRWLPIFSARSRAGQGIDVQVGAHD